EMSKLTGKEVLSDVIHSSLIFILALCRRCRNRGLRGRFHIFLCGLHIILILRRALCLNILAVESSVLILAFQDESLADLEVLGFGILVNNSHFLAEGVNGCKAEVIRIL